MMRLDVFLQKRSPNLSRTYWKRRIEEGNISVNGKVIRKAHVGVSEDAHVEIQTPESQNTSFLPSSWKVLFEDKDICVIDKPPHVRSENLVQGKSEWRLVHRLDKNTSGILVIAKHEIAREALQKQWQDRTVQKTYIALVKGLVMPKKGAIEAGIMRSFRDRKKMSVSSSVKARAALTEYKVLRYFSDCTLLEVYPKTGRTHQIRVHFSAIKHPVIGDSVYGDRKTHFDRQFLHASALSFVHPTTKKPLTFESDLPTDLQAILESLR